MSITIIYFCTHSYTLLPFSELAKVINTCLSWAVENTGDSIDRHTNVENPESCLELCVANPQCTRSVWTVGDSVLSAKECYLKEGSWSPESGGLINFAKVSLNAAACCEAELTE